MVSLTTVYGISIALTSLAGMGAAFVGNRIYPLKGGAVELPPTPADVEKATAEADKAARAAAVKAAKLAAADLYQVKKAQKAEDLPEPIPDETPVPEPVPEETPIPEPIPESITTAEPVPPVRIDVSMLEEKIKTEFNKDDEFAKNVIDFIKTPVVDWKAIAPTPSELRRKFMKTLTHANQNKCPPKLLDICKIVSIKYSNMKDFIENNRYTPFGDQTMEAIVLLSNTEQT